MNGTISIAILSARESPEVLIGTVTAALAAGKGLAVRCDVIVNGPSDAAARALCPLFAEALPAGAAMRVIHVPVADKAFAWNTYVHQLWAPCDMAFFIDGYARVLPDALAAIIAGIGDDPGILGGTGVPSQGRSAAALRAQMLRSGGIHGNLYALRGAVMEHFRASDFRLPLGIYRTDPTIASVAKLKLDPASGDWDERRIHVAAGATWTLAPASGSPVGVLSGQVRRMLRQAQGALENRAVRHHLVVERRRPEDLPRTAYELVTGWVGRQPGEAAALFRRQPLALLAYRRLKPWSGGDGRPVVIGRFPPATG